MRELLSELEAVRRSEAERARAISSFERELAQAVEAMNAERASWENERAAKADEVALKDEHLARLSALVGWRGAVDGSLPHLAFAPTDSKKSGSGGRLRRRSGATR